MMCWLSVQNQTQDEKRCRRYRGNTMEMGAALQRFFRASQICERKVGGMQIPIPEDVQCIIETLEKAGYEAYAVGGCVRDTLLGRTPGDWDITTSAFPVQVKQIFRRTVDTGIAHGTVTVLLGSSGYEVTTFRIDGEYEDARHPKEVTFTSRLSEDLKRRDFTINAMAYNQRTGIVDLFGGREDLDRGVIRCVGDARTRFEEDALRMMRAVRFSAQLGFSIEEPTARAISDMVQNLERVSKERIQVELVKLLVSAHPERMRDLYRMGISRIILPEWDAVMELEQNNPYHCDTVGEHTIHMLEAIRADKVLRLTALLHDLAKAQCHTRDEAGEDHFYGHAEAGAILARTILRRLKFDNETIRRTENLIRCHACHLRRDKTIVRRVMNRVGKEEFPALLEVMEADTLAKSAYTRAERLEDIRVIRQMYEQIRENGECVDLNGLAVNGQDLIRLGMKPGKEIGAVLHQMLEYVMEHPEENTKEILTERYMGRCFDAQAHFR